MDELEQERDSDSQEGSGENDVADCYHREILIVDEHHPAHSANCQAECENEIFQPVIGLVLFGQTVEHLAGEPFAAARLGERILEEVAKLNIVVVTFHIYYKNNVLFVSLQILSHN